MEQQHEMLESNQKLMMQLIQKIIANGNAPGNNTTYGPSQGNGGGGGGGGTPQYNYPE